MCNAEIVWLHCKICCHGRLQCIIVSCDLFVYGRRVAVLQIRRSLYLEEKSEGCGSCREGKSTAIAAHSGTVRSVNFSSNGRMLMSSSDDKTVKVWALPSQRFMFTLSGHMNWVRSAEFSPDCRLGVSGSDDKTMRIWDIQSKRLLRIYDENACVINTVAFHPDGTCVASAGTDKTIKVWDIRCIPLTMSHLHSAVDTLGHLCIAKYNEPHFHGSVLCCTCVLGTTSPAG
jgi:WD40 repeat protein